jgi:preprotein translocase subunit SecD
MLPHRKAYSAASAVAVLALASAVSGCSDSGGTAGPASPEKDALVRTTAAYTASLTDSGTPTGEDMRVTADRVRKRAAALGLKDTDVRVNGTVITITAPHGNADRLRRMTSTALLEFRPVLDPATAGQNGLKQAYDSMVCNRTTRATPSLPARPTVACDGVNGQKYLLGPTALDGAKVESASAEFDSVTGAGWLVDLAFSPAGSRTFAAVTGTLAQHTPPTNQFAIVVDGGVVSAPSVVSAITGGKAQISGRYTQDGAQDLAAAISSGALPVQLTAEGDG